MPFHDTHLINTFSGIWLEGYTSITLNALHLLQVWWGQWSAYYPKNQSLSMGGGWDKSPERKVPHNFNLVGWGNCVLG